jgi:hypothetical protein
MATIKRLHVGDVGVRIKFQVKDSNDAVVDLSIATTKQVKFKKPDGTYVTKSLSNVSDGTDGLVQYITEAGVIDLDGKWKAQCYFVLSSGFIGHTTKAEFSVDESYPA